MSWAVESVGPVDCLLVGNLSSPHHKTTFDFHVWANSDTTNKRPTIYFVWIFVSQLMNMRDSGASTEWIGSQRTTIEKSFCFEFTFSRIHFFAELVERASSVSVKTPERRWIVCLLGIFLFALYLSHMVSWKLKSDNQQFIPFGFMKSQTKHWMAEFSTDEN